MQKQRRLARDILRADPASHVPQLSSANNLAKGLVAIFQSLYAVVTLYRARGNQIEQYGFAAFGLTVSPYLIMSIVNLFSTLLTPDYPTTYLVKFEAMVEASKREGAKFEGVVGSIRSRRQIPELIGTIKFVNADDGRMLLTVGPRARQGPSSGLPTRFVMDQIRSPSPPWSRNPIERPALMISSCLEIDVTGEERKERHELRYIGRASAAVTSISIAINGALSHFKSGHSTLTQRVWTMTWLACGILFGSLATGFEIDSSGKLGMLFYGAPSIGGFVIVAQMLKEYGHCVQLFGEDI